MRKAAVTVEPRKLPRLIHVIRNHMKHLPDWDFYIACSQDTYDSYYGKLIPGIKHIPGLVETENLSGIEYNTLVASYHFWEMIEGICEKCLIFQYDTWMLHGEIDQFFQYDYLGAPWWDRWSGGNGGFSLRTPSVMKEITWRWNINGNWANLYRSLVRIGYFLEDLNYFCNLVPFAGSLAPREVNAKFSLEYVYTCPPMAIHKKHLEDSEVNGVLITDILRSEQNTTDFEFFYNNLFEGKSDPFGKFPLDIHEHLPILREYASKCDHVTEFGTRWFVSTYAFAMGNPSKLISYDVSNAQESYSLFESLLLKTDLNVFFDYVIKDVLEVEIEETDLLFIDTDHSYSQLKSELKKHSGKVRKYIIIHDTELFAHKNSDEPRYPDKFWEIEPGDGGKEGILAALDEFLEKNSNWKIEMHLSNCNGLTILKNSTWV